MIYIFEIFTFNFRNLHRKRLCTRATSWKSAHSGRPVDQARSIRAGLKPRRAYIFNEPAG